MLLFLIATFYVSAATTFSVKDVSHKSFNHNADELSWAETYSVKATKITLTSNLVEDYSAWKSNSSSRVDTNNGAVKVITSSDTKRKYRVHPETTNTVLNKIVCRLVYKSRFGEMPLEDILPSLYDEYERNGDEIIDDWYTTRFEYDETTNKKKVNKKIWAFYSDYYGWIPIKHEVKEYNVELGSLLSHEIWSFTDYDPFFDDDDVFDTDKYHCNDESPAINSIDSEKAYKELMFVDPDNEKHVDHVFEHFKSKFERNYAHEQEHALRKSIFAQNIRLISSVNKRNLTYKLGINQFSDWTPEELERSRGAIPRPKGKVGTIKFPYVESELQDILEALPKQYDMRLDGLISPIKDQGTCGSCWTFAAAAVTESGLARVNGGRVLSLSNQAIVDCAYEDLASGGGGGCRGGFDYAAYNFIRDYGLPTDEEYGPYKNQDGYCNIGNMTKTYRILGYTDVTPESPNSMKVALFKHGPLFIYVRLNEQFVMYSSGIFYQTRSQCNPNRPNHAVVLVGYAEQYGELYWILKNSWGESWGVDGYMLMSAKDNVCGVASHPSYPVF